MKCSLILLSAFVLGAHAQNMEMDADGNIDMFPTSTIGGGKNQTVASVFGNINGGQNNTIRAFSPFSTIRGGTGNDVRGTGSTVSGMYNKVDEAKKSASVIGGSFNQILGTSGNNVISGGEFNTIKANEDTPKNTAKNFIGGGKKNTIENGQFNSIGGGTMNRIGKADGSTKYATISGGENNVVEGDYGVAFGSNNVVTKTGGIVIGSGGTNKGSYSMFINLDGENTVEDDESMTINAKRITLQIGRKKLRFTAERIKMLQELLGNTGPSPVQPTVSS